MSKISLWTGLEATVNRVGDRYFSQMEKNGHLWRTRDLELFAEIGAERIRYPCLWEMVQPENENEFNWQWTDERLNEIRRLGLTPILGLIHHGSGPPFTSLIEPEFPQKFARYARAVAERYPWIEDYTPINEILTTARFSCLYGHWYPHHSSDESFLRAVINQDRATVLAMREIRKVNPKARLVQTDDLGHTSSTPKLQYQASFQNERHWLSYDFLCGKVNAGHKLYRYLLKSKVSREEILWFVENPCPPDIIGLNHYLLSNRYLDERTERYPAYLCGGNGKHQYADVGTVDAPDVPYTPPSVLFLEAWERYRLPLAITEVHTFGPRESQLRWFKEIWSEAEKAKALGADIRAVTAWSLLGNIDWHRLCTVEEGFYEAGVFDVRRPDRQTMAPRATALVPLLNAYSKEKSYDHPVLDQEGAWKLRKRFANLTDDRRKIVITGAGTLGRAFARTCERRGLPFVLIPRSEMDVAVPQEIERTLKKIAPWAVINTAGYVKVDQAERESDLCFRENTLGATSMAQACRELGLPLMTFSTDLVFDGQKNEPYIESDLTAPICIYGASKAKAEDSIQKIYPEALIVRTSAFFGPWDESNFITRSLAGLEAGIPVSLHDQVTVTPTYVPDLTDSCLDLLIDKEQGLLHLSNETPVSWNDFLDLALRIAPKSFHFDLNLPRQFRLTDQANVARRPRFSAIVSERVKIMPDLENAMIRYFSDRQNSLSERML